jgi:hypothetical protein
MKKQMILDTVAAALCRRVSETGVPTERGGYSAS